MSKKLTVSKLTTKEFISKLNTEYRAVHTRYERLFWQSYMGDRSVDELFTKAQIARETFRSNEALYDQVQERLKKAKGIDAKRLEQWAWFFSKYQTPEPVRAIFKNIASLEKDIHKKMATRTEGYIDPKTKTFVKASRAQMSSMQLTHTDEKVRKACFVAQEELAKTCATELIELITLRNEYATALGFEDFYAYKVRTEEDMSKQELFSIFDTIFEKTKYAFAHLREMEKDLPGLRKPWNRGYLLSGDFTKEADAYFPFEQALERWGRSFNQLGISFHGGTLQLDLLDRVGKYENGFCHWPDLVYFDGKKRIPGSANFTCNAVYGQVGSSERAYTTLFHEGGHAAHLLNTEETEACVNNEYPPASTAWDETQSMFLDTMLSSIEWKCRYAKTLDGELFPYSLFEKELRKMRPLAPLAMNGIASVMYFERALYEEKNLTEKKLLTIAKSVYRTFTDTEVDSLRLLSIPHIYSWESSCSYHGYGLAELALFQWREYFYKKYGYIVDNKNVGKEMRAMWKYASAKSFPECVKLATGKKLSPDAFLKNATASVATVLKTTKQRITLTQKVPQSKKPIELYATIKMVHGKEVIATNKKSFDDMAHTYAAWLKTKKIAQ
jgi:Zn-dependent oligopeptidase